jgi:hypothetical protein
MRSSSASNVQLAERCWRKMSAARARGNSLKPHCVSRNRIPRRDAEANRMTRDMSRRSGGAVTSRLPDVRCVRRPM